MTEGFNYYYVPMSSIEVACVNHWRNTKERMNGTSNVRNMYYIEVRAHSYPTALSVAGAARPDAPTPERRLYHGRISAGLPMRRREPWKCGL